MTIGERLLAFRSKLKLNQVEISEALSVSDKTYWNYEKNQKPISSDNINKLVKLYNLNPTWLLTGYGEMLLGQGKTQNCECNANHIPIKNAFASAGNGYNNSEENLAGYIPFNKDFLKEIGASPKDCDIIKIHGNSMCPIFNDGDYVMVDKSKTSTLDGIHVVVLDGDVYIKILQRLPGQKLLLKSLNKDYEPISVDLSYENFQVIGKVIWRSQKIF